MGSQLKEFIIHKKDDKTILVTGGAGYIGSHTLLQLQKAGFDCVVVDNLSTGSAEAVPDGIPLIQENAGNLKAMRKILSSYPVSAILHFAGSIRVDESVADPLKYYENNTAVSQHLLKAALKAGVYKFIFSSTAAVYGTPETLPVKEHAPTNPINPYGRSKRMFEMILEDTARAYSDFRFICLRYFNVAGAHMEGTHGQRGENISHLIKIACGAATKQRDRVEVYGTDYPTKDGTGVRDYIHVDDLAQAHVDALNYLNQGGDSHILNCGYGHGYSVLEVLEKLKHISGIDFKVANVKRRAGDPASLYADAEQIKQLFNWTPRYDDLSVICKSALSWERRLIGQEDADPLA